MTDLERAREALLKLSPIQAVTALVAAARREGADAAVVKLKAEAVAEAERRGAEEMRERAARVCDLEDCVRIKASALAADIRALSLEPRNEDLS